jgi:DNA-binding XRE family transcriptional regulator
MKSPEKTEIQNDGIIVIKPNGWQILRLRKKMGWSQGDMAKRLHLNSSTMISRYERDIRGMSPAAWELICIKAQHQYVCFTT